MSALVKSVVACTTRVKWRGSSPPSPRIAPTPATTARTGSSCVVSTLRLHCRPVSWSYTTTSVNVPPMSIPSE